MPVHKKLLKSQRELRTATVSNLQVRGYQYSFRTPPASASHDDTRRKAHGRATRDLDTVPPLPSNFLRVPLQGAATPASAPQHPAKSGDARRGGCAFLATSFDLSPS